MDNLAAAFDEVVRRHPDRVAIVGGDGQSTTFAALKARSDAFARTCCRSGLGSGQRVLIAMPIGPDLYAALCGLWRVGATAVFPEPVMGLTGLRHAARVTRPSAFAAAGWYRLLGWTVPELLRLPILTPGGGGGRDMQTPSGLAGTDALISFTTGTTGTPKAIARSHEFMMAQYNALRPILQSPQPERDLVGFPVMVLINLAEGRTSVLPNWRMRQLESVSGRRVAEWVQSNDVSRALLPPVLCEALRRHGGSDPLTTVFTGGGPVFPDVVDGLLAEGLRVVSVYGSTEAEPIASLDANDVSAADRDAMRGGAGLLAGYPVDDIAMRIQGDEIVVAGPHVNRGYLDPARNHETKIVEDGVTWHRTGDVGTRDGKGRLWLLGRTFDRLDGHGGPSFPFPIETAARFWPGVAAAALVAGDRGPILAICGDRDDLDLWQAEAERLGIDNVQAIEDFPVDRRHGSRVDRKKLVGMLRQR